MPMIDASAWVPMHRKHEEPGSGRTYELLDPLEYIYEMRNMLRWVTSGESFGVAHFVQQLESVGVIDPKEEIAREVLEEAARNGELWFDAVNVQFAKPFPAPTPIERAETE